MARTASSTVTHRTGSAHVKRTRPDYAREIWENGFRAEAERVAIEMNKDQRKKIDTTKNFWMDQLKTFLRVNGPFTDYIRRTYPYPEDMGWATRYGNQKVSDAVWSLLYNHFSGSSIKVPGGNDSAKIVTRPKNKSARSSVVERSGSTGKVVGSTPAVRSGSIDISNSLSQIKSKWSDFEKRQLEAGKLWGITKGGDFKLDKRIEFMPNAKSGVVLNMVEIKKAPNGKFSYGVWYQAGDGGGVHGASVFDTIQYPDRVSAACDGLKALYNRVKPMVKSAKDRQLIKLIQEQRDKWEKQLTHGAIENGNDSKKKSLQPPSALPVATEKPQPLGQVLFGNPKELASLVAFCDAQLELWSAEPVKGYYTEIKRRLLSQASPVDHSGNDSLENRYCQCGCGELLTGNAKQRFVNNTHKLRAWRRK